jgi:hypothetical protein
VKNHYVSKFNLKNHGIDVTILNGPTSTIDLFFLEIVLFIYDRDIKIVEN